jgi:hypothetical protein
MGVALCLLRTFRWGGITGMLGGVLWAVWGLLVLVYPLVGGGPFFEGLFLLAALLTLGGPFMPHPRSPSETCSYVSRPLFTRSGVAFPQTASLSLWLCWSGG